METSPRILSLIKVITYVYLLLLYVLLVSVYICVNTYYMYLFVSLVVSHFGFEDEAVVLFASVPGKCNSF